MCVWIMCVTTCHHYHQHPTDQEVRSYFNFSFGRRNQNSRTWIQFHSQAAPVHSSGLAQLAHSKPQYSSPVRLLMFSYCTICNWGWPYVLFRNAPFKVDIYYIAYIYICTHTKIFAKVMLVDFLLNTVKVSIKNTQNIISKCCTYAETHLGASICTHGKALTGQIMEGNVFHFRLFEKTGTIFPSIPLTSLFIVCRICDHTQFKTTAIFPTAVEFTACTEIASDCEF